MTATDAPPAAEPTAKPPKSRKHKPTPPEAEWQNRRGAERVISFSTSAFTRAQAADPKFPRARKTPSGLRWSRRELLAYVERMPRAR